MWRLGLETCPLLNVTDCLGLSKLSTLTEVKGLFYLKKGSYLLQPISAASPSGSTDRSGASCQRVMREPIAIQKLEQCSLKNDELKPLLDFISNPLCSFWGVLAFVFYMRCRLSIISFARLQQRTLQIKQCPVIFLSTLKIAQQVVRYGKSQKSSYKDRLQQPLNLVVCSRGRYRFQLVLLFSSAGTFAMAYFLS